VSYAYRNVCIVRVVDVTVTGRTSTWNVGLYGGRHAGEVALDLESVARDSEALTDRQCFVEPLYSDDRCLLVADDGPRPDRSSSTRAEERKPIW